MLPNSDSEKKVLRLCIAIIAGLVVLDHATKLLVVHYIPLGDTITVIPGLFNLVFVLNPGAAWGILAGQGWILFIVSMVVLVAIIMYIRNLTEGWPERYIALSMIISGIIGNSVDRVWRQAVVDFLDFHVGASYHWPAFNVADSAITIGVTIYILSSFLRPPKNKRNGYDSIGSDDAIA